MKLRDYQIDCLDKLKWEIVNSNNVLFCAPTGSGKTVILIELIKFIFKRNSQAKVLFLVNRIDLLEQTRKIIESNFKSEVIYATTIQSVSKVSFVPTVLILDEAHNVNERKGRYYEYITELKSSNPTLLVVATTATPFRLTGNIYGQDKTFKKVAWEIGINDLIEKKAICDYVFSSASVYYDASQVPTLTKRSDYKEKELGELVAEEKKTLKIVQDALSRIGDRKKVVWACVNINHLTMVCKFLTDMGQPNVGLHSKLSKQERHDNKKRFETTDLKHLVFVSVVSEGYDYPSIDCICYLRPTKSTRLMIQTIGRGLRLHENKIDCLVLDYGRVHENCGSPKNPRYNFNDKEASSEKSCSSCLVYISVSAKKCPYCGFEPKRESIVHDFTKSLTVKPAFNAVKRNVSFEDRKYYTFAVKDYKIGLDEIKFNGTILDEKVTINKQFNIYIRNERNVFDRFISVLPKLKTFEVLCFVCKTKIGFNFNIFKIEEETIYNLIAEFTE